MKIVLVGSLVQKAFDSLANRSIEVVGNVPNIASFRRETRNLEFDKVLVVSTGLDVSNGLQGQLKLLEEWVPEGISTHVIGNFPGFEDYVGVRGEWLKVHVAENTSLKLLVEVCDIPNPEQVEVEERDREEILNKFDSHVVGVVGVRQGSGVSFVVNNLAYLAGKRGKTVVVVESKDKPELHNMVGQEDKKIDNVVWVPNWKVEEQDKLSLGELVLIDVDLSRAQEVLPLVDELWIVSEAVPHKSADEVHNLLAGLGTIDGKVSVIWNKVDSYVSVHGDGVGEEGTFSLGRLEASLASKASQECRILAELPEAGTDVVLAFEELVSSVK